TRRPGPRARGVRPDGRRAADGRAAERRAMLSRRLARRVRALGSLAPLVRLVPRPPDRPEGVSALVRVGGDEEWIEPCLASLRGFADEILVLDHAATAGIRALVDRIGRSSPARLRRIDCGASDLPDVANRGLAESRFRWAFLWDADLVARTEGPSAIANLRRLLARLDRRRYYLVHVRTLELAGDLRHRFPDARERWDPHVLTVGPRARYVWGEWRISIWRPGASWRSTASRSSGSTRRRSAATRRRSCPTSSAARTGSCIGRAGSSGARKPRSRRDRRRAEDRARAHGRGASGALRAAPRPWQPRAGVHRARPRARGRPDGSTRPRPRV